MTKTPARIYTGPDTNDWTIALRENDEICTVPMEWVRCTHHLHSIVSGKRKSFDDSQVHQRLCPFHHPRFNFWFRHHLFIRKLSWKRRKTHRFWHVLIPWVVLFYWEWVGAVVFCITLVAINVEDVCRVLFYWKDWSFTIFLSIKKESVNIGLVGQKSWIVSLVEQALVFNQETVAQSPSRALVCMLLDSNRTLTP